MPAINNQSKKSSDKNSIFIIGGIILVGAALFLAYLMWYVSPESILKE